MVCHPRGSQAGGGSSRRASAGQSGVPTGLICSRDVLLHQQAGGRTQRSENWRLNVTLRCVVGESRTERGVFPLI